MKFVNTITLLLLTLCLGAGKVNAQPASAERVLNQVIESLIAGDANKLSQYFSQKVELTINGATREYTKTQASFVIREFFREFPSVSFKMIHSGSTARSVYMMGELTTGRGSQSVNVFIDKNREEVVVLKFN